MMEITHGDFKGTDAGLTANLRIEKISDGTILVRGGTRAGLAFHCVRCLEPRERTLEAEVDAVLLPSSSVEGMDDDQELTAEDMDVSFYDDSDEELDLTDVVREALLLEMPTYPTCADDEECTPHQLDVEEDEPSIDPRWQALAKIKERMKRDDNN